MIEPQWANTHLDMSMSSALPFIFPDIASSSTDPATVPSCNHALPPLDRLYSNPMLWCPPVSVDCDTADPSMDRTHQTAPPATPSLRQTLSLGAIEYPLGVLTHLQFAYV